MPLHNRLPKGTKVVRTLSPHHMESQFKNMLINCVYTVDRFITVYNGLGVILVESINEHTASGEYHGDYFITAEEFVAKQNEQPQRP